MKLLERFARDVTYGFRLFSRSPGFTAVVILTLALGIGANTAVFSIVNAVLLRPLPYKNPDRLVVIWDLPVRAKDLKSFDTYRDFEALKSRSHSFERLAIATWANGGRIFSGRGPARDVLAMPASLDFFSLLGVSPALGRTFERDDLNRGCTAILRHRFWKTVLGGERNVIGRSVRLDDKACTVIGVMPQGFTFYPDAISMWTLITPASQIVRDPDGSAVGIFGRLKPGVSLAAALREVQLVHQEAHRRDRHGKDLTPMVYPLQEEFTFLTGSNLRLSLIVLFCAVTFVLLIACVNVANLLMGRSLARHKEFAVRSALGSGRARLMLQLLTEGMLLSFSGAVLGTLLAAAAVRYFRAINPIAMPPGAPVSVSLPVLAFTAGLAVFTALIFGLVPAWKASQTDLNEILKGSGAAASRAAMSQFSGKLLVVAEVALSVVLLAGAGLLIRSVVEFASVPLGFSTDRLLTVSVGLPRWDYARPDRRAAYYDRLLGDIGSLPAAEAVALSTSLPLGGVPRSETLSIQGEPAPPPDSGHDAGGQSISPDYFRVLGVRLERGRMFDARDRANAEPVAIVNRALAQKYFAGRDPIGRRVKLGGPRDAWLTVVGVVANEKNTDFFHEMTWANDPTVFRPIAQSQPYRVSLILRTAVDPALLGAAVEKQIAVIDNNAAVSDVQTMHQRLSKVLAYPRFRAVLLGVFAGLALLLASIGLYGVLSQLTAQRTREIGLRMALGARKADVLKLVLRQGMLLAAAGVAAGLVAAWFLAKSLGALLYGAKTGDPLTLAAVSLVLIAAALLATWLPARRAAKVDPVVALRYE